MRKYLPIFFAPIGALIVYLVFVTYFQSSLPELKQGFSEYVSKEISDTLSAPPPLFGPRQESDTVLDAKSVVAWTNNQRRLNGQSSLVENSTLTAAAQKKVNDMFNLQYFAHESPLGKSAKDWVKEQKYEFVLVGENLALGNYEDDQALVQAWMDSPGHRANILKTTFEEIGVAVKQGIFEGDEVWLAVQIFARPLTSCPQVQEGLLDEIDRNDVLLEQQFASLNTQREELKKYPDKKSQGYQNKVEEFNSNVDGYNNFLQHQKSLVESYNQQVQDLNACIESS
jgi:uncharacterized protein YkwD/uncharacterized protein YukE